MTLGRPTHFPPTAINTKRNLPCNLWYAANLADHKRLYHCYFIRLSCLICTLLVLRVQSVFMLSLEFLRLFNTKILILIALGFLWKKHRHKVRSTSLLFFAIACCYQYLTPMSFRICQGITRHIIPTTVDCPGVIISCCDEGCTVTLKLAIFSNFSGFELSSKPYH